MPDDAKVTNIREVRGKDGSTAYEVTGGSGDGGEVSYYISKDTFHEAETQGTEHLRETLRRGIETSLEGRRPER